MLDIIQKFINLQKKKTLIFPRYHQLDVVRKLIVDVRENGAGKNYLIQHSAGSGKSNSIAWTAYRLASLFNGNNKPIFSSVIVVTDRTVLDEQLQETVKYAHMAFEIIKLYRIRLQERKTEVLAQTVTECYKKLANKKNLIDYIKMDN